MSDKTIAVRAVFEDQVRAELKKLKKDIQQTTNTMGDAGKRARASGAGFSILAGAAGGLAVAMGTKLVGAVGGVVKGFISAASKAENLTLQFKTLLGSEEAAIARMEELKRVASTTPFQLTELANASRVLETLTQGALSTADGLRLVGDSSAATGADFQNLAMHVGRAYDGLQNNRPVGEALMRLQELGIISGDVRGQIEALQKQSRGKDAWRVLEGALGQNEGAMEDMSKSLTGLYSTFQDTMDEIRRRVMSGGALDGLKTGLSDVVDTMNQLIDSGAFDILGQQVGELAIQTAKAVKWFGELVIGAKEYFGLVNQNDEAVKAQIASMREQISVDLARVSVLEEQIAAQEALQKSGGSAFQPSKLQEARNELQWLKEIIKESNMEMQKLLGTYTGAGSKSSSKGGGASSGGGSGSAAPKKRGASSGSALGPELPAFMTGDDALTENIKNYARDAASTYFDTVAELEKQYYDVTTDTRAEELERLKTWHDEKFALIEGNKQAELHLAEITEARKAEIEERYKEQRKLSLQDWTNAALDSASTVMDGIMSVQQTRTQREKRLAIERVRNSTKSEKDKQKEIEKIEKGAFEKQKTQNIMRVLMDGAVGAAKTIANVGLPAAFPLLALQAVATATSLATVKAQKFADGGVVDGPSAGDSTLIAANGGELMLNRRQTGNLFRAIDSGRIGGAVTQSVTTGSIIVQGNANRETVREIRRSQQEQIAEIHDLLSTYKNVYGSEALV